jgi:predicted ATPase
VDNCEHVLDEVAELVDALLERCPRLRILATSREALELDGERTFRVPSLAMTDESGVGPAVRLFVERAVSADDRLVVDDELLEAAREVCERLDGIPLAIELAAARVRSMDMSELVSRLEDRFSLLTGGRRGAQQRQRTLQAALDWSHDLLSSSERMVFRRLAVFVGDFGLDAVVPVADVDSAAGADVVDSLVAKSLLVMNRQPSGTARYRLLETVRHYSEDRLVEAGETEECLARHRQHYVSLVRSAPFLMGDWRGINSDLIEPDSDNISAAADRARDQGDHTVAVLLHALGTQANAGSPRTRMQPALEAIRENIELARLTDADRGPVMLATAAMSLALGRFRESREALDSAVACIGDPPAQWALTALYLQLLPKLMSDPESALDEIDRLTDEVVPLLPSPAFGALILAEARSMGLTRLRRYVEVAEKGAVALATARLGDLPLVGHTPRAMASSGLIATHLAGRPHLGEPFIALASDNTSFTWWYPYLGRIGECLHLVDTVDIDTARSALVSAATSDERTRLSIGDSGYLTAFARLAHLEGDDDRAVHFLAHTAVLFPSIAALAAETLGTIEGWTNEEFFDRSTSDMLTRMSRRRRVEAQATVPALLRAELDRWTE